MSNNPDFVLRNYPDDDALTPGKYSKAVSFSPDIIPQYGNTIDPSTLVSDASWRGFSGYPIVGGEVNNVYIRGYGSGGQYIANLRAFPSELILWPQVWYNVPPVASGPVMIPATGPTPGRYASSNYFQFRPPHTTGNSYALVANVVKYEEGMVYPPPLPFADLSQFGLKDFISFLSTNETFTFYNVIVADPTVNNFSVTTRLRMFNQLNLPKAPRQGVLPVVPPVTVGFRLNWNNSTNLPKGLEVSLVDNQGKIALRDSAPFSNFSKQSFAIDPMYDGTLMLNVFTPPGSSPINFEPYSGFALQVLDNNSSTVLGTLNVIFEPNTTRNLRFASPAAVQLREVEGAPADPACKCPSTNSGCSLIPVTGPVATGWWTRNNIDDTNNFPHPPPFTYSSPDIQPIGTVLESVDLTNPAIDYSTANSISLVQNHENYVFLRGHSTLTGIDVQSRIFAINMTIVNNPSTYLTQGVPLKVVGGNPNNPFINETSITVANSNQFYVFENPFDFSNPPTPDGHYCFCVEFRQKRQGCPLWPGWPSDEWANIQTLADFTNWILTCPLACWRNICWQFSQPGPQFSEWVFETELLIPDSSSYSSFWTIIIECENGLIPSRGQASIWRLVSDDNSIFPNGLFFDTTPITRSPTQNTAVMGANFTGVTPGYKANFRLTVLWYDGGDTTIPAPSVSWRLALTETVVSPITHLTSPSPSGSEKWPFYVTTNYPFIGKNPNPSPLPTFGNAGPNAWPYAGAQQFNVGQVTLSGKRD